MYVWKPVVRKFTVVFRVNQLNLIKYARQTLLSFGNLRQWYIRLVLYTLRPMIMRERPTGASYFTAVLIIARRTLRLLTLPRFDLREGVTSILLRKNISIATFNLSSLTVG